VCKMFNKDFGKLASDLLKKDYPTNVELTINSNTPGYARVDTTTALNVDGTYTTVVRPTFPLSQNIDFEGTLSTTGVQNFKLVARNLLTAGLKANLSVDHIRRRIDGDKILTSQKISTGADYVYKSGTVSAKLSLPALAIDLPDVVLATVYTKDNLAAGVEAALSLKDPVLCDRVTINAEYRTKDYVVSGSVITSATRQVNATGRYFYRHQKFDFGSEINWNGAAQKGDAAVGLARLLQGGGLAKVAFRTSGAVGLSFKQRLSNNTSLLVGTEVDISTLVHNTGINFEFDC